MRPTIPLPSCRLQIADDVAFLQYTSGSTSTPKGVMVAHDNLLANLEMIRMAMSNTEHSTSVGWVPLYHDMGLMMGVMQPLYLGAMSVLMAPAAFMQRPLNWLHTIHQYRAELTSAPNFAFDLCVSRFRADQMEGVDLSCWKLALNGAEPVHADTIARFTETFGPYGFDPGTMYPGYGLAEATLLVAGGVRGRGSSTRHVSRAALQQGEAAETTDAGDAQPLVSCGHSLVDEHIAIVDPDTAPQNPAVPGRRNLGKRAATSPAAIGATRRPRRKPSMRALRTSLAATGCAPEISGSWTRAADCSSPAGSRTSSSSAA